MSDGAGHKIGYAPVAPSRPWYRQHRVWIAGAILLSAAITVGGYFYISAQIERSLSGMFAPHAIAAVTEAQWQKLTTGMTKAQVTALLGRSESVTKSGSLETWEYNWTDGLPLFYPSTKAYVVCFGADGKVFALRRPLAMTEPTTEPTTQP